MTRLIDDIKQDLVDLHNELEPIWVAGEVLNAEDLIGYVGEMVDVLSDLADATNNEAQDVVTSAPVNTLSISRRQAGSMWSYWSEAVATSDIVCPAHQATYLATVEDFPELADYQGARINMAVPAMNIATSTVLSAMAFVCVDNTGIYVEGGGTGFTIGAGTSLAINFVLALGDVEED